MKKSVVIGGKLIYIPNFWSVNISNRGLISLCSPSGWKVLKGTRVVYASCNKITSLRGKVLNEYGFRKNIFSWDIELLWIRENQITSLYYVYEKFLSKINHGCYAIRVNINSGNNPIETITFNYKIYILKELPEKIKKQEQLKLWSIKYL